MFFTRIGAIIAYIGFGFGFLTTSLAIYFTVTLQTSEENVLAAQRYLSSSNIGEALNSGLIFILVSVVLGVLCEISRSVRDHS